MIKIKVIFLDIDGVLKKIRGKGIDTKSINNLNELIEKTGANIVISSRWRINGMDYVQNKLGDLIVGEIIDVTPLLKIDKKFEADGVEIPRGSEIKEWIKKYTTVDKYVENYVIIDDCTDILYSQVSRYVHVDQTKGFDDKCLKKAIEILNIINMPTI